MWRNSSRGQHQRHGRAREAADSPTVGEPSCVSRKETDCFMEEVLGTLASQVALGGSSSLAAKL